MKIGLQHITCHGCGAQVEFKTTDSLLAICPYCHTHVTKDEEKINSFGKKSEIVQDFSKIQIGTTGDYRGEQFTVIGRVQIKYTYGYWNEWYILFSNGLTGWLSDVMDEYSITLELNQKNFDFLKKNLKLEFRNIIDFPDFDELEVDKYYLINNTSFYCIDLSVAKILGAEGEIGFDIRQYHEFRVADFKGSEKINSLQFLTVDYSEKTPKYYIGEYKHNIQLSNTKNIDDINNSTGEYKGKLIKFSCPSCGSENPKVSGITSKVFCINCGSEIDANQKVALVLNKAKEPQEQFTSLKCGKTGRLRGKHYLVLGVVVKTDDESIWNEYFLYEKGGTFSWLIEFDGKWYLSNPTTELPVVRGTALNYKNEDYKLKNEPYFSKILYVWGSFNWEICKNDLIITTDYIHKNKTLELSKEILKLPEHQDVSYSINNLIPIKEIMEAFKLSKKDMIQKNTAENKKFYHWLFIGSMLYSFVLSMPNGVASTISVVIISFFIIGTLCIGGFVGELLLAKYFEMSQNNE